MQKVTMPSAFAPYHLALADMVYHDIIASPNQVHASLLFWNGMASLMQRGMNQQQLEEFLNRVAVRLAPVPALGASADPRFGASARQMLNSVREAREVAANATAANKQVTNGLRFDQSGQHERILRQINIAWQILQEMGDEK